jgi:glutamate/tyrosine decarboxylase-like PLP-dependent enzyme
VRILVGAERHVTVDRALRFLGFGQQCIEPIAVAKSGAMRADAFFEQLQKHRGPTIVCAQVGNVNTGAVDPVADIVAAAKEVGAWVHVDGAFGLWANTSQKLRGPLAGCERADSWATDTHKWLNTPYDCGFAAVADREAHQSAMQVSASYLQQGEKVREPMDWTPEFSRRARSIPVYAALSMRRCVPSVGRESPNWWSVCVIVLIALLLGLWRNLDSKSWPMASTKFLLGCMMILKQLINM